MKVFILLLIVFTVCSNSYSQGDTTKISADTTTYRILKFDGSEFVGKIISRDPREILLQTKNLGLIYIPQHTIKDISAVHAEDFSPSGEFIGENLFSTRYFITTNGLPIKKGEHYVQWNLYGPDFQFGVAENFGVGIMTSWIGMPIIGTAKYSFNLRKKTHLAIGTLAGTGSWALPDWGLLLPYGALSVGDRKSNLTFSAGYGLIFSEAESQGRALTSIAGMTKIGKKLSLVFDSFILLAGKSVTTTRTDYIYNPVTMINEPTTITEVDKKPGVALLIPGIRLHIDDSRAFQFGFAGVYAEGEFLPLPLPMIQWYRRL
jgi:hypothetical protein